MWGTADLHHQVTDTLLPQANAVFDDPTAFDDTVDMLDLQPTLVELLVHHVLLPRELLPQIEINSVVLSAVKDGELSEDEAIRRLARSPHWLWTAMEPETT